MPGAPTKQKVRRSHKKAAADIAYTSVEYPTLQQAFAYFNVELFAGELPNLFITYQRKSHSAGYFSPNRFAGRSGKFARDELALNPDSFINRSDEWICSTLVHEMCHAWQEHRGTPSARGYHNKQWAAKMKSVGLQPSNTGMVGGKETGQHMSDYVIVGGRFSQSFKKLAKTGWKLNLQSAARPGKEARPNNSKTKFSCQGCEVTQNCWGKPDLDVICGRCRTKMVATAPKE